MYTGDTSSTATQGNTKSTIQALLKSKENPLASKQFSIDFSKGPLVNNNNITSELSDLRTISKNLEFESNNEALVDHVSSNVNSQDNLEYQRDFNYSQKLFHIADGNLYSIFSPIQGRSYGMKPSFLRKQKYTVQECHNRGRKSLRKGLKFHNFLPSESVTSEKDNGYLNTKWKVHSECRLREEHGTKQITISNWSHSVKNPPDETNYAAKAPVQNSLVESNCTEELSVLKYEKNKTDNSDPYDFNLNFQSCSSDNINMLSKINKINFDCVQSSSSTSTKKDTLNILLNSLMEKPLKTENKNNTSDESDTQSKSSCQKHRRKPVQTRRVVPYVKYLSIMEENESLPLDLSSKCLIENSPSHSTASSSDDSQIISGKNDLDFTKTNFATNNKITKCANLNYTVSSSSSIFTPNISSDTSSNSSLNGVMPAQVTGPVAVLYPLPFNKSTNMGQNGFPPPAYQTTKNSKIGIITNQNVNSAFTTVDKPYSIMNLPHSSSSAFSVQKSFVKEVPSKSRRRNQRSAIKQRLEDTFRQNGFLVKTKQVSDGEATFCKFRQLRKYTRYYLKSLEQHLPDEFHKMWKGFLPPKTVLPPVSGTPESSSENIS